MFLSILNLLLVFYILFIPVTFLFFILKTNLKFFKDSYIESFFLLGITFVFLNKLFLKTNTLLQSDFNNIQVVFFRFYRESLLKFFLPPLWKNNFGGGFDAFSNPLSSYLSPFAPVLLFFKEIYFGMAVFLFLQIFFALIFYYSLYREYRFFKGASLVGAVVGVFNGFLTMRLSPGVGVEYFFTYKWAPLVFLFGYRYFKKPKLSNYIYLSISLAFLFVEGNLNVSIGIALLFLIFIILYPTNYKSKLISTSSYIFAFVVFAVKFLPALDIIFNSSGRVSGIAEGWRVKKLTLGGAMLGLVPLRNNFLNSIFAPGLFGVLLSFTGVMYSIFSFVKNRSYRSNFLTIFNLLSLLLGLTLISDNPLSNLVFSLPLFNRLTIIPTFTVYIILSLSYFAAYFLNSIYYYLKNNFIILNKSKFGLSYILLIYFAVSSLLFLEVLVGPSTFGVNTYSFNFAKMDYESEFKNYPLYNSLPQASEGNFIFIQEPTIFMHPFLVDYYNLSILNPYQYFFGSKIDSKMISDGQYTKYANLIVSTVPLEDQNLILLEEIDYAYTASTPNFMHFTNLSMYKSYRDVNFWNEKLYLYFSSSDKSSLKYPDNNPVYYSVKLDGVNIQGGDLITSFNYSKNWLVNPKKEIFEDQYGYLGVRDVSEGEHLNIVYYNKILYIGLLISTLTSFYVIKSLKNS